MSNDAEVTAPKQHRVIGTPFPKGVSGNPAGRPKGAKSKLSETFLSDLRDAWEQHGATALRRCAEEEPATLIKVIASLLPKDINLSVGLDAASFADKFHAAAELLGHDVSPPRLQRRSLRTTPKLIEHAGSR
jgi:hypothetical protein